MARQLEWRLPQRALCVREGALAFLAAIAFGSAAQVAATPEVSLRGKLAAAVSGSDMTPRRADLDLRYEPELSVRCFSGDRLTLLAAGDARLSSRFLEREKTETDADADLYRLWLRYGAPQFEARVGLQKLSFGSATLLRPLMWFDSVDPRDPLRRTEGVYALLLRYYRLNNANFWLWGLLGNDEPKGWEAFPSLEDEPEFGGRLQLPVGRGEAAITFHQRLSTIALGPLPSGARPEIHVRERRVAIDGKWDVGIGAWCEGVLQHQDDERLEQPYQVLLTAGFDTTIPIGQGVHALAEQFLSGFGAEAFGKGRQALVSAVSLRYPWSVVDELGVILHYDEEARKLFSHVEWRRTFDHWSFHLIGFVNPDAPLPTPGAEEHDRFAGSGAELLVVFDH